MGLSLMAFACGSGETLDPLGTGGAPNLGTGGGTGAGGGGFATGGSNSGGTSGNSGGTSADSGGTSGNSGGQAGSGGAAGEVYNPEFVEFYGEDCTVGEPTDVNDPKLPDLFESFDGTRISKKSDWRCRRAELKKAVEKYLHGTKPGAPDTVTGTVTATAINVHVEHMGKSADFSVTVSLPAGASGPVPVVIGLGGVGGAGVGDADFGGIIKEEGVATANYNHNAISSESSASGEFVDLYGGDASAQVGWAWGISRVIDVLVAEKAAGRNDIIDPTAVGVTGCSRNGKGAFTVGAFDERIALGIPQESGTGGVSALRVVNTSPSGPNGMNAESISAAGTAGPRWFGKVFDAYKGKVDTMPTDMHALVAMYAPRGLLVLDNSRIGELCSTCEHAASVAGGHVFTALGVEKNIEYHGGNPGDPHNHCSFYVSQADPLKRAIRAHLTRTEPADGRIVPAAVTMTDLDQWIDWTPPTLP